MMMMMIGLLVCVVVGVISLCSGGSDGMGEWVGRPSFSQDDVCGCERDFFKARRRKKKTGGGLIRKRVHRKITHQLIKLGFRD